MGKETVVCSPGPFKRSEIKPYEYFFTAAPKEKDGFRVILIDCSSLDRIGSLEPYLKELPIAIIDHHYAGSYDAPGELVYLDKDAPSTTFLIFNLIKALYLEPLREEAELLFFGLCTDTGFFRHVGEGGAVVFEFAAALIHLGASPKAAFLAISGGKSLNSRWLIGHALTKAESHFGGKLILSFEEYEDTYNFGAEGRDSDSLNQLFQSVAGVEAIVIIRQETPEKCSVSFRSLSWVDVASIAVSFGGGGHKNAAGTSVAGTIADIKPKIINSFKDIF
jgi:phosphoesterase RecJ-like protein